MNLELLLLFFTFEDNLDVKLKGTYLPLCAFD